MKKSGIIFTSNPLHPDSSDHEIDCTNNDLNQSQAMVYSKNFFLRKERANSRGEHPIYFRITYQKQQAELSLNRYIYPSSWDGNKVVGRSAEARTHNEAIDNLRTRLSTVFNDLIRKEVPISAKLLKNKILGIEQKSQANIKTVLSVTQCYIDSIATSVKLGEHEQTTLERYITLKKHLSQFIQIHFQTNDIGIQRVNHEFIADFFLYLKSSGEYRGKRLLKKACKQNSALKYIKNFKSVIRKEALAKGFLITDPFLLFKEKGRKVKLCRLTEQEVNKLMAANLENDRLSAIRDFFVFQCFTGLAYADLELLSGNHIEMNINNNRQIRMRRKKSDTEFIVPLLPPVERIIDKYKNHPVCLNTNKLLPIISNQNYNNYLKELAVLCDIDSRKNLTTHVARRSFASIALNNGIPIETIIIVIGHSNFSTVGKYAEFDDETVDNSFSNLKLKYK